MDKFIIETSARHVHVSQEALEILFGAGYELTPKKDLWTFLKEKYGMKYVNLCNYEEAKKALAKMKGGAE